jgi:hypothetical protein
MPLPYVRLLKLPVLSATGVVFTTATAWAYIDPGTGSMLLQVVAAAIFGALFTMKSWIGSIKSIFYRNKPKEASKDDSNLEK